MAINFEELNAQYEDLSNEIDELAHQLDRILHKKYAIEQILDHHSLEAENNVDL